MLYFEDMKIWRNSFTHSLQLNYEEWIMIHPDLKVICHLRSVRTSYAVEAVWENLSRFPAFGDLRFACLSSATEERDIEREGERAAAWLAMAWLSLDRNFDCPAAAREAPTRSRSFGKGSGESRKSPAHSSLIVGLNPCSSLKPVKDVGS